MHAAFRHCKGCTKRYPGCHSKCQDYKDDVELWQDIKEQLSYDKDIRSYLDSKKYKFMDYQARMNKSNNRD
jgi:hypothetical protein